MTPDKFRRRFPGLAGSVHLASCSFGARSTLLDEALAEMLADLAAYGAPWPVFEQRVERTRRGFAAMIRASSDEVAVLPSATVGAYQVASGLDWSRRPRIISCHDEFASVAHVWLAQRARRAEVVFAGSPDRPASVDDYVAALDERTGLVSIPLVSYRDAARLPVAAIAAAAHAAGARVIVDAYQSVGTQPVDVARLGCDYLVSGVTKYLLGLPGVAYLFQRRDLVADQPPELTGWFGRTNPSACDPYTLDFAPGARGLEISTPAIPAVYAADAGLTLIGSLDLRAVRQHIAELCDYAEDRLTASGERLRTPSDRGAHVALVDADAATLSAWLADRGVIVSPRGDLVRLSLHYYNTAGDVDLACNLIARYRRCRGA